MKIRLTKQAEANVAEAFEWYERKSLILAIALSLASVRLSSKSQITQLCSLL